MKTNKRNKIALFFLLVYVPVAMGVSFFHSHNVIAPAEQQQISTQEASGPSVAQPDLFCTICKFLSSYGSVFDTNRQSFYELSTVFVDSTLFFSSTNRIFVLSDRAPPFLV